MKENEIHPDYYKLIDIDIDFPIPLLVKIQWKTQKMR